MKQIIGIAKVDYLSKKTNRQVKGANIYCTYKDEKINGLGTFTLYMNEQTLIKNLDNLDMETIDELLGLEFNEVIYNQYGNALGFYL